MGNYFQPFSLRVPEEIIEKMKIIAKQNKRSANKEMELVLQNYIDLWEKENGKIEIKETKEK